MSSERMHPGQLPLDEALVRRLVARQFPAWAAFPVRRVTSGGTVNAMFRLGTELVVRLPLTEGGSSDVLLEREWLPQLADRLPFPVPQVLGAGEPDEEYPWPWSVYTWLPGSPPAAGMLREPSRLAGDLAQLVSSVREIRLPGGPQAHRGGPLSSQDAETRRAVELLRGIPEEDVDCEAVTACWEDGLAASAHVGPPVWLHADLMPGNLLVDGAGRLGAVIDFGCTGRGDPSCDLFPAWNLLPSGARQTFRDALAVTDDEWRRGRARTLSQAVVALPYYRRSNLAMADNARHVIREVLAEA